MNTPAAPQGEDDRAAFEAWKADRDEQARTRGAYCLTAEGRADIRNIFTSDDWPHVLLGEVERLEAALAAERAKHAAAPLNTCTREAISPGLHAMVYGRVKLWRNAEFHWSRYAWWKAMWYPHRGPPNTAESWGVYAGNDGYAGPGGDEFSHWAPMLAPPVKARSSSWSTSHCELRDVPAEYMP